MSSKFLLLFVACVYGVIVNAQSAPPANDAAPTRPSATGTAPSDVVGVRDALDEHLATTLKDATAASQYAVSELVPCATVIDTRTSPQATDGTCICYRLDAISANGSPLGGRLNVAMVSKDNGVYRLAEIQPANLSATVADGCRNLTSRDADNIHKLAK